MIQVSKPQLLLLISSYVVSRVGFLVDATSVKMDYLPIGHARVDPILRDDCPSDHVHTFYGPQSGVDPRRLDSSDKLELHSKLRATDVAENTGNVEENKSLYWHPTVYKFDPATKTYTRDIMAHSSAYYVWDTGYATAFPNGFRMIGGFDINKSFANAECVNESPCDEGDCYTENDFFPVNKCEELEVSMRMPNCWDGVSIESPPNHTDHVAYSDGSEFHSECPSSHPIKLPQIQLFFRIQPYDGGWHTFSDLSGVYHADYVSGWDEEFLQGVLDDCENEGDGAMPNFFCEDFLTYRDAPKCTDEELCDFSDPALLEKVQAFQPPPLDVKGTIVAEETDVLVGELPRVTCNGSLVGDISSGCEDDATYRYGGNPEWNCEWMKTNNISLCKKSGVSRSCPKSCNVCPGSGCEDKSNYKHKGKRGRDCDWVKKKAKKNKRICKGRKVKSSCPVACNTCYLKS